MTDPSTWRGNTSSEDFLHSFPRVSGAKTIIYIKVTYDKYKYANNNNKNDLKKLDKFLYYKMFIDILNIEISGNNTLL